MQRRSKGHEESWLLSYADLITNLLLFFVVLLTAANLSKGRMQQIVKSISGIGEPRQPRVHPQGDRRARSPNASCRTWCAPTVSARRARAVAQLGAGVRLGQGEDPSRARADGELDAAGPGDPTRPNTPSRSRATPTRPPSPTAAAFATNWELSSARAIVVRQRLEDAGVARDPHPRRGLRRHQADPRAAAQRPQRRGAPGPSPPRHREDLLMRISAFVTLGLVAPLVGGRPRPDRARAHPAEAHPARPC